MFIGECISARVSYLEIKFDDKNPVKQKCSGLIVSTGTGSTSWTYNVNKLTEQSLEQVSEGCENNACILLINPLLQEFGFQFIFET